MQIFTEYCWNKGEKTEKNQDSLAFCQIVTGRKRCLLAVVCDGIGSLSQSEEASGFVTEQLIVWFCRDGPKIFKGKVRKGRILRAGQRTLYRLHDRMKQGAPATGTGTTVSMIILVERRFFWWNAGDGRIYQGRRGKIPKLLTRDDVLNHRLTRCVGSFSWQGVAVKSGYLRRKDTFLLCTDGFWGRLSKEALQAILMCNQGGRQGQMQRMLREVVAQNRARGERDDASAIFIQVAGKKEGVTHDY